MSSVDLTKPTYSNGGKHLTMTAVPVEPPTVVVETAVAVEKPTVVAAVEKPTVVAEHRSKPAAELSWRNVTYTIKQKKQTKEILSDVSGSLEAASLLAIMGPSGSGKTSLLNTLAGRVPITRSAKLHGSVLVNGVPCEGKMPMISAYVEQDEALFALSTVRETFAFAARLRLPPSTSEEARARRVDEIISELGLVACADTLVGNQRVRGVSGGERKRVNIGVELLNDPPLVFLDEPTSGLDSFQAQSVMETLRKLARAGRTVVASVHQPRSSIYAMLDRVMLLSGGRTVYFGTAGDAAAAHFAAAGYPVPIGFNPADHFMDVICVDRRDPTAEEASSARVESLVATWRDTKVLTMAAPAAGDGTKSSLAELEAREVQGVVGSLNRSCVALRLLTRRTLRELTRDKAALIFQYSMNLFFAVMFGLVYLRMGTSQVSLQNRTGILFFMAMNQAFGSSIDTATVIPRQLQVVSRERAAKMYGVLPFYMANFGSSLLLQTPMQLLNAALVYFMVNLRPTPEAFFVYFGILLLESQCAVALGMLLSAAIKSTEVAPQVAPAVVVLFLMFSGYFLNEASIPVWLTWLSNISFIGWTFQALCINEFQGRAFDCDGPAGESFCFDGDTWLANLNFDEGTLGDRLLYLVYILAAFHAVAYLVLVLRAPKFLPLKPHGKASDAVPAVPESPASVAPETV